MSWDTQQVVIIRAVIHRLWLASHLLIEPIERIDWHCTPSKGRVASMDHMEEGRTNPIALLGCSNDNFVQVFGLLAGDILDDGCADVFISRSEHKMDCCWEGIPKISPYERAAKS